MSTAVAENNNATGKMPLNKVVGIGMAIYAVIEAVAAYFLVLGPLFVNPVFAQCDTYNEQGVTCMVKLFGKTFASAEEIASHQVILTLWDTIFDLVLIYIIATGVLALLAFCFYKGFAFAKSYLIAVFGAKAMIGVAAIVVPFANIRNTMKIFCAVDALLCIAGCVYCAYISAAEHADDMLMTPEQIAVMKKRGIDGGIMFAIFGAAVILESFAMSAFGGNWSIYLGWLDNTAIGQGAALVLLLAVALVGAVQYIREADWAMYFNLSFGAALAVCNLLAVIFRVLWIFKTYNPTKALANQGDEDAIAWVGQNGMTTSWWIATVCLILTFVASAVLAFMAFTKIKHKISFKFAPADKKPALAVMIGSASVILSFVLTIVAVTLWDKIQYQAITLGAMDYMYFVIYGGISLFFALAMLGGYSFTKLGSVVLFIVVASSNFSTIFAVFSSRSAAVASGLVKFGTNYIIAGILYIVSIIVCLAIIALFVVKEVNNYMYEKRYN